MDSVGIRSVVIELSIDDQQRFSYYPSSVVDYPSSDVVGRALNLARKHGMRAWIGLGIDRSAWYSDTSFDVAWLRDLAERETRIVRDLQTYFADRMDIVEGWYFPGEDTPWGVGNDNGLTRQKFYRELSSQLDAVSNKRLMISPYYHATPGNKSANDFSRYLSTALEGTGIDVVALQTCADMACSSADATDQGRRATVIAEWMRATREGVRASGSRAQVWANVELFSTGVTPFAAIDDVVATMRAAQPYADGFTSWSFGNQWASDATYGADWWVRAYLDYVSSGSVPASAPDPPRAVSAAVVDGALTVNWSTPPDQHIAHLELLRRDPDGFHRVSGILWNTMTSATFDGYVPGAQYLLRTRNAAGARSVPVVVPVGPATAPELWSSNAPYVTTPQASASYPDSGLELTDGKAGSADFRDIAWQGRQNAPTQEYAFDLGGTRPVRTVEIGSLSAPQIGIGHPTAIAVETSPDGAFWSPFADAIRAGVDDGRDVWAAEGLATARCIRLRVSTAAEWTFLDEVRAIG